MIKNKIYIVLIVQFLIGFISFGQDLKVDWVNHCNSDYNSNITTFCNDSLGNVYYGGTYKGETIFKFGNDSVSLISSYYNDYNYPGFSGFTTDFFISKVDKNGSLLWIKNYGSIKDDNITNMIIDQFGNLIVVGSINPGQFVDFDTDPKTTKNISGNFLLKLNSNGDFKDVFSTQFTIKQLIKDSDGNIVISGGAPNPIGVNWDVDFDINDILTHSVKVWGEIFILKLDSSLNFKWVKLIGNNYFSPICRNLNLSNKNEIILSGEFRGTIDFDPSDKNFELESLGTSSAYVLKLDVDGNFLWSKSLTKNSKSRSYCKNSFIDKLGNVYSLGHFSGDISLDHVTLKSTLYNDVFISKVSNSGVLIWFKQLKSQGNKMTPHKIVGDGQNHLFVFGQVQSDSVCLNPDSNQYTYFKGAEYILYLDDNGSFIDYDTISCASDFDVFYTEINRNKIIFSGYYVYSAELTFDVNKPKLLSSFFGGYLIKSTFCFPTKSFLSITSCNSFTWSLNDITYTKSGVYVDTILNKYGCDSIVTLNLTINNDTQNTINKTVCDFYYVGPWTGYLYESGEYTLISVNNVGCVNATKLNLKVLKKTYSTLNVIICDSYSAPNGQILTNSGTYTITILNKAGCDSVITVNLLVKKKSFSILNRVSCDSFTAPNNVLYTKSGVYTIIIPNKQGCDSVITLNLTINKLVLKVPNDTNICKGNSIILKGLNSVSTIWNNGVTDNISFIPSNPDTYTAYGTDLNGCKDTANVKVDFYPNSTISLINNNPTIICEGQKFTLYTSSSNINQYYWYRNGELLQNQIKPFLIENTSGNYFVRGVSMNGCSKNSDTLNFIISTLPSIKAGENKIICTGEKVQLKASNASNYTWSNGIQNGDTISPILTTKYIVQTQDEKGCKNKDSLTITVLSTSESTISLSSAEPFILNGITYKETGTYYQKLKNSVGCDSTITLNLVVENLNNLT